MSRVVVLFGPPGCGKGTQAARLKDALAVPHISTGDMFRDHKARGTDLGRQVAEIMAAGKLVPDSITNDMVRERLARPDVAPGALLDGYPRNVDQLRVLDEILDGLGRSVSDVVVIEVPHEELVRRLIERGRAAGREDDQKLETVEGRLATYRDQSEPCIGEYERTRRRVHHIEGVGSIDDVTGRILAALRPEGAGSASAAPARSSKKKAAKKKTQKKTAKEAPARKAKAKPKPKAAAPKKKAKAKAPKKKAKAGARARR
jgi:adenylate kinase